MNSMQLLRIICKGIVHLSFLASIGREGEKVPAMSRPAGIRSARTEAAVAIPVSDYFF